MRSLLTAVIGCLIMGSVDIGRAEQLNDMLIVRLDHPIDQVVLPSEDGSVLLVANISQRLTLLDLFTMNVLHELGYGTIAPRLDFHDAAITSDRKVAYLVGVELAEGGLLTRLDLDTFEQRTVRFVEPFFLSTVAVDLDRRVFVGDLNSTTITVVGDQWFEKETRYLHRSDLPKNVYLKNGPALDIGAVEAGRFVAVSHGSASLISLVDVETSEVVDEVGLGWGDKGVGLALTIAVLPASVSSLEQLRKGDLPGAGMQERQYSVLVGDLDGDRLLVYDVDPDSETLRLGGTAKLGLRDLPSQWSGEGQIRSPLVLSADREQRVIAVGRRDGTRVVVFSRFGSALERQNIVELADPISDMDVSPDGNLLAILNSAKTSLTVIRNPGEWAAEQGIVAGFDEIREAQRLLSELQYPIGVVDGLDGPKTRRAVSIFQETVGLTPRGAVDERTLQRIRDVAAELRGEPSAPSAGDNVALYPPDCLPISDEQNRCEASSIDFSYRLESHQVQGVICPATTKEAAFVQFDYYGSSNTDKRDYVCTTYHSCAFIRFQFQDAYNTDCAQKAARP
jgi:peptidoglycan hydrolase-like protein with peptidoglycan-binding domain